MTRTSGREPAAGEARVRNRVDVLGSYFDSQAFVWRDMYVGLRGVYAFIQRQRQEWVQRTIHELNLPTGTSILEVGIGSGSLAVSLAGHGMKVVGVDVSSSMLELTRQAARTGGVDGRVSVALADGSRLPFRDHEFPVVTAIGVVPWVTDAPALVAELRRVLAPSGHLVITADNNRRLPYLLDPRFNPWLSRPRRAVGALARRSPPRRTLIHGLTRSQFHRLLSEFGLEIRLAHPLGFGPFTLLGRQILPERFDHSVNAILQKGACRGVIGLRGAACQHLVLARAPA